VDPKIVSNVKGVLMKRSFRFAFLALVVGEFGGKAQSSAPEQSMEVPKAIFRHKAH
jgi:hypothetical protein